MKPHKHAAVIKAWAENTSTTIQMNMAGHWRDCHENPSFNPDIEYRIKPAEPVVEYPVTRMSEKELEKIYEDSSCEDAEDLRAVANAAIRRAIDDGQVVIAKEFYDAINMAHKAGSEGTSLNVVVHLAGIKFK